MRRFVVVLCLLAFFCASPALARTWTSRDGQTTTGKFVRLHNGNVVLMRGGRVITIPFQNFCDADQAYIREKAGLPADLGGGSRPDGRDGSDSPTKSGLPEFNEGPGYGAKDDGSPPGGSSGEEDGETSSDEPTIDDLDLSFVEERTWTSADGREIRAKLVPQKEASDKVTLLKDGKQFEVPRDRLSAEDLAYVDQMQERIDRALQEEREKRAAAEPPKKSSPFPTWQPPGTPSPATPPPATPTRPSVPFAPRSPVARPSSPTSPFPSQTAPVPVPPDPAPYSPSRSNRWTTNSRGRTSRTETASRLGFMVGALLVRGFFIVLVAALAARKNRSAGGWALLGFLFGIFSLLVLMFMSFLCPRCRRPLTNSDWRHRHCPSCGRV